MASKTKSTSATTKGKASRPRLMGTGRRSATYRTPESIRSPLLAEAERRFEEVFFGERWVDHRSAFEADVDSVVDLLEAYTAARKVTQLIDASRRASWADPRFAPMPARVLLRCLEEVEPFALDAPNVNDVPRTAIVATFSLVTAQTRTRRGDFVMVVDMPRPIDEEKRVTLATAVSILLSERDGEVRPELGRAQMANGMTCAAAFDRERKTIKKAAKKLRELEQLFAVQVPFRWTASYVAALVRSRSAVSA